MNLKGFAAAIVIFAVVVLAVVGAIAWVHYYYLPHMAAENNTMRTVSTSTAPTAQLPATSIASTSTVQATVSTTEAGNATGLISCASNDLTCLIAAARTCSPASVEWSSTLNLFGAFIQATKSNLTLGGIVSGKCSFSNHVDSVSLAIPSTTIAQAEAKGITAAQIQQQLKESDAQAQQSVGMMTKCTFTTSYLTQMLTNWSEGNLSSNDLAPGNCTATEANGKPIQIYTGESSIPLTPVGTTTVYLSANEQSGINGIDFKVNSITTSELNVTITNSATGQSQTVSFTVDNPVAVFGHTMTVTSIGQVSNGTIGGQPAYIERATLTYN